jgi:hypothetical protein
MCMFHELKGFWAWRGGRGATGVCHWQDRLAGLLEQALEAWSQVELEPGNLPAPAFLQPTAPGHPAPAPSSTLCCRAAYYAL